jgi:hypothetical protein
MYWIWLQDKHGKPYIYRDSFLPGLIPPEVLQLMLLTGWKNNGVEMLDICDECPMDSRCHVLEEGTGRKFCTVLFHDAVKPPWKISEVL